MVQKVLAVILAGIGTFFFMVGTTGLLRMPDIFARLHPSTKCDTLGAGSILLAMAIYSSTLAEILRLAVIGMFLLISSATCGHAIGRSAVKGGVCYFRKEGMEQEQRGGEPVA
jgi:monovalent cation/proton antiporter MnhG/PhaG subunit